MNYWLAENRAVGAPAPGHGTAQPVPGDKTASTMYTAHRVDDIITRLLHAGERLGAARKAHGDIRKYESQRVAEGLAEAQDQARLLVRNLDDNYPAEAAELKQILKLTAARAKSVSPTHRAATFAHLLQTTMYNTGHAQAHADAMAVESGDAVKWDFDAAHCEKHLDHARDHAGRLADHIKENYPVEAGWLAGLGKKKVTAAYGRSVSADYDAMPDRGPVPA